MAAATDRLRRLLADEALLDRPFDLSFVVRAREGPDPVEIVVRRIVPSDPPANSWT